MSLILKKSGNHTFGRTICYPTLKSKTSGNHIFIQISYYPALRGKDKIELTDLETRWKQGTDWDHCGLPHKGILQVAQSIG